VVNLVHGLGEHSGRYAHVAKVLNNAGYHLASFDLRGHGLSEGKRGHANGFDQLYDDIDAFITEINHKFTFRQAPFLYGHSLGGSLVINFAMNRNPNFSGVIATAPALATAFKPPKIQQLMAKVLANVVPAVTVSNSLAVNHLSHDQAIVNAYQNDALVHDKISVKLATELFEKGQNALAKAGNWQLPLLLMHGTDDRITSHQASQAFKDKANGKVELILWEDFYHEIHNDFGQEEVLQKMVDWMDKIQS
jgi:alpha-beta hydrolase superfamily lysophospholipase